MRCRLNAPPAPVLPPTRTLHAPAGPHGARRHVAARAPRRHTPPAQRLFPVMPSGHIGHRIVTSKKDVCCKQLCPVGLIRVTCVNEIHAAHSIQLTGPAVQWDSEVSNCRRAYRVPLLWRFLSLDPARYSSKDDASCLIVATLRAQPSLYFAMYREVQGCLT